MSSFTSNLGQYNISTENEVASILTHFDSQYIFNIAKDNLARRYTYNVIPIANLPSALEQNFKMIEQNYQSDIAQIRYVKNQTYNEIIDIICNEYKLQFNAVEDENNFYSAAYYLYEFFVSSYMTFMVRFFANYIYRERSAIYESMNLSELKKNKDNNTSYYKKTLKEKDLKLAVINANLDYVIQNLFAYDIDLNTILATTEPKNIADYISYIVTPTTDFFKSTYVASLSDPNVYPLVMTQIRLEMQKIIDSQYKED